MSTGRSIQPDQAVFWNALGGRFLEAGDVEPHGIEYLKEPARLREIRRRYPVPTVVDVGHGIFGAAVGLLFVDDEDGRAVAFAPPHVVLRAAIETQARMIRVLREGLETVQDLAAGPEDTTAGTLQGVRKAAAHALNAAAVPPDS